MPFQRLQRNLERTWVPPIVAIALAIGVFAASGDATAAAVTVTSTVGGVPGAYTITYRVTNILAPTSVVSNSGTSYFELPEIALGDLDFYSPRSSLPTGWGASEYGPGIGAYHDFLTIDGGLIPGGYIDLVTNDPYRPIAFGETLTFVAAIKSNGITGATFAVETQYQIPIGTVQTTDFPRGSIPNGTVVAAVPEPSTLASLGIGLALLAGALRTRRPRVK